VEFYGKWIWPAIREAGRLVTLDLRGWVMRPGLMEGALGSGVPLRLSTKYWGEHLGRPYPPAETWPNYSYLNFLERPNGRTRPWDFYFELWGLGSHRLLLWGDPEYVRRAVSTFGLAGASGFEIDPPLAQKGFGNRPGRWGVSQRRKTARSGSGSSNATGCSTALGSELLTPRRLSSGSRNFSAASARSPTMSTTPYRASSRVHEIVAAHR
jgi:hypothetical protein